MQHHSSCRFDLSVTCRPFRSFCHPLPSCTGVVWVGRCHSADCRVCIGSYMVLVRHDYMYCIGHMLPCFCLCCHVFVAFLASLRLHTRGLCVDLFLFRSFCLELTPPGRVKKFRNRIAMRTLGYALPFVVHTVSLCCFICWCKRCGEIARDQHMAAYAVSLSQTHVTMHST